MPGGGHGLARPSGAPSCAGAPEEAQARPGTPAAKTGQGRRSSSLAPTPALTDAGHQLGMDGRGRWMGNGFVERLWRALKPGCVGFRAFEASPALRGPGSVDQPPQHAWASFSAGWADAG